MKHRKDRENADPVGDEIRRVEGPHNSLAQNRCQERLETVGERRIGRSDRDQFEQRHVPRRIEEMQTAETRAQGFWQRPSHFLDRETGSVGRENDIRLHVRRDPFVEIELPVHALGDRLNHQIAVPQLLEVLVVVRGFNMAEAVARRARRRRQFFQIFDRPLGNSARVALLRGQIEQNDWDVGVDHMRSDLGAHHPGAQNGRFFYPQTHPTASSCMFIQRP